MVLCKLTSYSTVAAGTKRIHGPGDHGSALKRPKKMNKSMKNPHDGLLKPMAKKKLIMNSEGLDDDDALSEESEADSFELHLSEAEEAVARFERDANM